MKILIAPSFGAGWSTWSYEGKKHEIATYKPIIDYIEAGGDRNGLVTVNEGSLVQRMLDDLELNSFYTGAALDLVVDEIPDGSFYRLMEFDGSESLETPGAVEWWNV